VLECRTASVTQPQIAISLGWMRELHGFGLKTRPLGFRQVVPEIGKSFLARSLVTNVGFLPRLGSFAAELVS
jgi:hypothetical protein